MDTQIDVIIRAEERPLAAFLGIHLLFEQQEQRYSRFRPGSQLSRLNADGFVEDPWFAAGMRLALDAHERTGGIFNPLILESLAAAGYDRSFRDLGLRPIETATSAAPIPSEALTVEGDRVTLTAGRIDLGGIVKGWTVDLAVQQLAQDYPDVLVNAGGDMRIAGTDDDGPGWAVEIDMPGSNGPVPLRLQAALATSSTLKRRWRTAGGSNNHHLIDPATGKPAKTDIVQASVLAPEVWLAETWAKSVIIGGPSVAERAAAAGMAMLAVARDGTRSTYGPWPA